MEPDLPPSADLSFCASVLRNLRPSDLQLEEVKEVLEAGVALFRRHILKEKFGSGDAVDFLKEKNKINHRLKKLNKLHDVVTEVHADRRRSAEVCGMNQARKAQLAAIVEESQAKDDGNGLEVALVSDCRESRLLKISDANSTCETASPASLDGEMRDECDEGSTSDQCEIEADVSTDNVDSRLPCKGDLHSYCNVCRGQFSDRHHFYHQLCSLCAEFNMEKRAHTADMTGMVCVVTGGRVRIGYEIALKLLRAGAFVLTTTRFPSDCALRYSREADFESWKDRLEVCGPFELSDMRLVERFCDQLVLRFPRIHVLINNAAQTLTRRDGWEARMASLEDKAATSLPTDARVLLRTPVQLSAALGDEQSCALVRVPSPGSHEVMWREAAQLEDFPEGVLDESRQPLDLSVQNSWSCRLGEISTLELLQTLAANTAAPFIMCSRLACRLSPQDESGAYGHIINVSAMEGKFAAKFKSTGHPHTNMAKAGLNMLTHTSAPDLFHRRILMNCVDTGWVTDMAPGGVGRVAKTQDTFVGPPLDEVDGAARVLDPIFRHLNDPSWLVRGKFFKNYYVSSW